jgi:hypothetical protein
VIVDGEGEYEVKRIEDSRMFKRQLQYLVMWKGYDEWSWEPAPNVDRMQAINIFHSEQPTKHTSDTW